MGAQETTRSVRRALERLPYYGVFDFMAFGVDRGTVTLMGYTYHGSLKSAAERATKRASGVDEVANKLEVLPPSPFDDRIRWATFYKIYTDSSLSRYAPGGVPGALREAFEARQLSWVAAARGVPDSHHREERTDDARRRCRQQRGQADRRSESTRGEWRVQRRQRPDGQQEVLRR